MSADLSLCVKEREHAHASILEALKSSCMLQCVAVCCSVLQFVAVRVAVCCSVLRASKSSFLRPRVRALISALHM